MQTPFENKNLRTTASDVYEGLTWWYPVPNRQDVYFRGFDSFMSGARPGRQAAPACSSQRCADVPSEEANPHLLTCARALSSRTPASVHISLSTHIRA